MPMNAAAYTIRPINETDNPAIAAIIRAVMPEFGASGPGFAIHDAEVDTMAQAYAIPRAAYFVVERDGAVLGGGGVAALSGGDADTCELRKMYFLPALRGLGAGQTLIALCLATARDFGYRRCYLETLSGMDAAQALYLKNGFQRIAGPLGGTGHYSCDKYYLREL
ncbi:MAG: N-acetyltransferase [Rhodanobacteraceae bacterium]|nr:N-acetyltransferase [Rhodanobacteraceae bacterium]